MCIKLIKFTEKVFTNLFHDRKIMSEMMKYLNDIYNCLVKTLSYLITNPCSRDKICSQYNTQSNIND